MYFKATMSQIGFRILTQAELYYRCQGCVQECQGDCFPGVGVIAKAFKKAGICFTLVILGRTELGINIGIHDAKRCA